MHMPAHRVKFSDKLLPGTWIERHMKEAEEKMGVLDERPENIPGVHAQRQRTMPGSWRSGIHSHEGAAPTASDGITGTDAGGAAAQHAQHDGRLPDLPLYQTGMGGNSSGGRQQSTLPHQADAGGTGHRQQSRQHRDGAGVSPQVGNQHRTVRTASGQLGAHPKQPVVDTRVAVIVLSACMIQRH